MLIIYESTVSEEIIITTEDGEDQMIEDFFTNSTGRYLDDFVRSEKQTVQIYPRLSIHE